METITKLGSLSISKKKSHSMLERSAWKLACSVPRGQRGSNPPALPDKLFGSESHKNLLLDIVNAVLARGNEPKVVELEILNPYNPKTFLTDKLSVVDIKAKSESGEWFIIEVQVQMSGHFPRRLLYYR